jgi:hypothetical protein
MNTQITVDGELWKPLLVPVVNLNGNSAHEMVDEVMDVRRALDGTISLLRKAVANVAHGRNFQTTEDVMRAVNEAQDAWVQRYIVLHIIQSELEDLALAIQRQDRGR